MRIHNFTHSSASNSRRGRIPLLATILATLGAATADTQAQTILADSYLTSLDVDSPTTLYATPFFPSFLNGPLTGSSTLTLTSSFAGGQINGQLSLVHNGASNTFAGDIIVDSGVLRVAGSPFGSNLGFTAPSMTSSNTITINRPGTFTIDDRAGYTANRFGTVGQRPNVDLAGGRINLLGVASAPSSLQTFGALTSSAGRGIIDINRSSLGTPTLAFSSLAIDSGSLLTFSVGGGSGATATTLGTGGANDAVITFTTAPTLNDGILAGARYTGPGVSNAFVTYGVNGVRAFTASDYTIYVANDINAATSTQNVQMTGAVAPVALAGNVTVNSLNYNGDGGTWSLGGNTLTIDSGMFSRDGTNQAVTINNGTLTAGDGIGDIDLNVIVVSNNMTISAVIADNSASAVTLVKSGDGRPLTLDGSVDNTYTGGTFVTAGSLSTGTAANRTYLGTGKVTVNGATLNLGGVGATSNAAGDDYTAINAAQINIASGAAGAYTASDTFNIGADSVISGGSAAGQGLASLTRGTNVTLASGAIIGHGQLSSALNTETGTIQNLGSAADLYYGLNTNQNNSGGQVTIGNGTAFRGISTDTSGKIWQQGTVNIASGTTSVDFKGVAVYESAAVLTLGNGTTAGSPIINVDDTGTVNINAIGLVTLNDDTAVYGNTSQGRNIRFVATAGSTLTASTATAMGSGTGVATAMADFGGSLAVGNAAALNGAVTVGAGGRLLASQAAGLTGVGTLTFNEGSILEITNATGFSGSQATGASLAAGTIVRLNVANFGDAGTTLDSIVGGSSPIYQVFGTNRTAADPTNPNTTILTLNKNGSGVGGILTNDVGSRSFNNTTNGHITLGANGGVIAATSGTNLTINENITGAGSVTFGTTAVIDGAPKLGTVILASSANDYTGGTIVNAGTVQLNNAVALGSSTGQLTVNTGGTLNLNNNSVTVGNLTGTEGVISGGGTLTIGNGNLAGGIYQGSIVGGSALTKTGVGIITLSGVNSYTGVTTISGGTLQFGRQSSLYNGTPASWTAARINVKNTGTLALNVGGAGEFTTGNITTLLTNLANSSSATNGMNAGSSFGFDTTNAAGTFTIADIIADSGGASGGARGLTKLGTGTLELTNVSTYSGVTTVTAGTLLVSGSIASGTTVSSVATLGGTGTIAAPVTIGGILAPGNGGIGTLSVTDNVTWNAGNSWLFQLGAAAPSLAAATAATDSDLLDVVGAFNAGTGSGFTFDFAGTGSDGWYRLVDYTTTSFTSGSSFQATNVPAGKTANFTVDSGSSALYVQIVPEPTTVILATLGLGGLACGAYRRRWTRA
jgi:fibronectin-binding autotransporter adhesin